MTFPRTFIANMLVLVSLLMGSTAWAAGLPLAGYRALKLPAFISQDVGRMEGGRVDGTVDSMDEAAFIVVSDDGTGYTVDVASAKFLNADGKKTKREVVQVGHRVVIDGYFAKNSTAMDARRIIDVGMAILP